MTFKRILLAITILLATGFCLHAYQEDKTVPVVIVTSYNPDVKSISDNVSAFSEEFALCGLPNRVTLENMNCLNLSESLEWKDRLWSLLEKYYRNGEMPAAVVLLGNEASSTFFSMDIPALKKTPVLFGMRGDNITLLPEDRDVDLVNWYPDSYYLTRDFDEFNIVGGVVYDYDIAKTLSMIGGVGRQIDTLAFISDNTFGGVTMQAHFLKSMKSMPQYAVKCFDGRRITFPYLDQAIGTLSDNTAIVLGTWRVDSSDSYALKNTTYTLAVSNPSIPTFTLASVGLGHWAIGGYSPDYMIQGGILADAVADFLKSGDPNPVKVVSGSYTVDYAVAKRLGYNLKSLPEDTVFLNKPVSFFREHTAIILLVTLVIAFLICCLTVTLYHLKMSKTLQHHLEKRGEELAKERDRAEKASAMKSSFIANISHEIRTPLNAVVGFSQLLSNEVLPLSAEEKQEYSSHIMLNSNVLLNLIDEVLDLSKLDADRIVYNYRMDNLVEVARSAADAARLNLNPDVSIIVNSSSEEVMVETDKERLYQVFCNLLSNAKKFTNTGSITIDIDTVSDSDMVIVSVTDTGCGIPEDKAKAVFDRFVKLDPYQQGTGLGLSIVQSIVKHFGGKIKVDTSYKEGARFVFTHPYAIRDKSSDRI